MADGTRAAEHLEDPEVGWVELRDVFDQVGEGWRAVVDLVGMVEDVCRTVERGVTDEREEVQAAVEDLAVLAASAFDMLLEQLEDLRRCRAELAARHVPAAAIIYDLADSSSN